MIISMKKLCIAFAVSLSIYHINAQTLISIGNTSVNKDEFWRAYNKNKQETTDKEKSLREYVALYSNFKLKVKAAQDMRLDTLQQIQYDLQNFRNQIMENYLSDDKGLKKLQDEAFGRSQHDRHALHFSVPASGADSAKAFAAINELYNQLKAGKTDYLQQVKNVSDRYIPVKQSDLGFITAFTVPYEYENIVYGTPVGEASKPYRSKTAWHIFKVLEEKPAAGKWKVAQILFTYPADANEAIKTSVKHRADSVYDLLQNGLAFGTAAKQFSEDKLTYLTEGEIPEFTSGKFTYAFESEVFKLKQDGEISKPFETPFGYHIVKRISQVPVVMNKADENYRFELKQKVMADTRINVEREKFAKEIISKTGIVKVNSISNADLYRYADTLMKDPSVERTMQLPISKKPVLVFTDRSVVTGGDWLKFVRDYRSNTEETVPESNAVLWNKFITYAAVEYYKNHLENYNEDFKFQMKEFKEGNMLFEVMERNVWNKAISDVRGLQKYYAAHKEKYKWGPSADILIFNCATTKIAEETIASLQAKADWHKLIENGNAAIQADSGRYELNQIIGAESVSRPEKGLFSKVVPNADGTAAFVEYLTIYPGDMQRSFEEARGLVINDYQGVLEEQWLKGLRAKYPVKLNEPAFHALLK